VPGRRCRGRNGTVPVREMDPRKPAVARFLGRAADGTPAGHEERDKVAVRLADQISRDRKSGWFDLRTILSALAADVVEAAVVRRAPHVALSASPSHGGVCSGVRIVRDREITQSAAGDASGNVIRSQGRLRQLPIGLLASCRGRPAIGI
jgi:hypothetical protein